MGNPNLSTEYVDIKSRYESHLSTLVTMNIDLRGMSYGISCLIILSYSSSPPSASESSSDSFYCSLLSCLIWRFLR